MTDFKGTDRIRKVQRAIANGIRHVRSWRLKGMTAVQPSPSTFTSFLRQYRAPINVTVAAALAVVIVAIGGYQYVESHSMTYYRVVLNGQPVGYISKQEKVIELLNNKAKELKQAHTPILSELNENQVAYEYEKAYKAKIDDEATLRNVESHLLTHTIGVKLIVGGKPIGVVRDQKTADNLLQRIKEKYVPGGVTAQRPPQAVALSSKVAAKSVTPKRLVSSVNFVEKVETEPLVWDGKLDDPEKLYAKLVTGNTAPIKYTVKDGDCLGCIANELNVSPETIYDKNPWIEDDKIKAGDVLDLTELKPMLNVQSVEQVTQTETIEAPIEYHKSDSMRAGQSKVVSPGADGQREVTYRLLKKSGSTIEEEIIAQKVLQAARPTIILKGTKVILGEGTGKFSWPVTGHLITSYMGERWGRLHKGIDMIGSSNIKAADNGVVIFAGYKSGGLGNAVIIDHKNGFRTVYGHMKKVLVKSGEVVQKGDSIGVMGSTGHSTGTHLHFEVYLNSKLKNPTGYL